MEFIYLTAFNKYFGILQSNKLILFLEDKLKENSDFNLYKIFYKKYFQYKIPSYQKLNVSQSIIKKSNKLLGNKFYTLEMYNNLNGDEKKFLINLFYSTYIDKQNYIDIHPIIFNYKMYLDFAKEIGENTSNGIRIIIGESFNKIGLLMDLHYKSNSYYIPFSKNIFLDNKFTLDTKYNKYLTSEYLTSFKYIITKLIPYDIMKNSDTIYIYDLIDSGKGIISFLHIFNLMFPELKNKLKLVLISNIIGTKYDLYYQHNNIQNIETKLKEYKINYIIHNFKCNIYILSVFTEEKYNNRCFKSLPIEKINSKQISIFKKYSNTINKNNLIKFYIIDRFE